MNRMLSRGLPTTALTVLVLAAGVEDAQAQTTFTACRVPDVGAIYMIGVAGAPSACLDGSHVEFSWTEGGEPADGSITEAKLADDAVTSAKIKDGTITSADIADGSVAPADLASTVSTPLAWAFVNDDATLGAATSNVESVTYDGTRYVVSFTDISYFFSSFVTVVTSSQSTGVSIYTNSVGGDLLVYVRDELGSAVKADFQFVTFGNGP